MSAYAAFDSSSEYEELSSLNVTFSYLNSKDKKLYHEVSPKSNYTYAYSGSYQSDLLHRYWRSPNLSRTPLHAGEVGLLASTAMRSASTGDYSGSRSVSRISPITISASPKQPAAATADDDEAAAAVAASDRLLRSQCRAQGGAHCGHVECRTRGLRFKAAAAATASHRAETDASGMELGQLHRRHHWLGGRGFESASSAAAAAAVAAGGGDDYYRSVGTDRATTTTIRRTTKTVTSGTSSTTSSRTVAMVAAYCRRFISAAYVATMSRLDRLGSRCSFRLASIPRLLLLLLLLLLFLLLLLLLPFLSSRLNDTAATAATAATTTTPTTYSSSSTSGCIGCVVRLAELEAAVERRCSDELAGVRARLALLTERVTVAAAAAASGAALEDSAAQMRRLELQRQLEQQRTWLADELAKAKSEAATAASAATAAATAAASALYGGRLARLEAADVAILERLIRAEKLAAAAAAADEDEQQQKSNASQCQPCACDCPPHQALPQLPLPATTSAAAATEKPPSDRLPDFALHSAGAYVIGTRCTVTYSGQASVVELFGFPLLSFSRSPTTALEPDTHLGECWAFQGFPGHLIVRLALPARIDSVTLDHAAREVSYNASVTSAPRNFTVYGLEGPATPFEEAVPLGSFAYNADRGPPSQTFQLDGGPTGRYYEYVELVIETNHGNQLYTCLYRFRVHGLA